MIRNLRIERFKSLVRLELELGRINVFVGANGSGKSNLLEAVGILGSAAFGRVDDETLLRRGVRPGVPSLYKTAFPSETKCLACYSKPPRKKAQNTRWPFGIRLRILIRPGVL